MTGYAPHVEWYDGEVIELDGNQLSGVIGSVNSAEITDTGKLWIPIYVD